MKSKTNMELKGEKKIVDNFTIFDMLYDDYKINKSIRLIECFAGYGSQALALKYLGVNFEHWKICEWATKSIQAYKDAHFTNDNTDYSKGLSKEQVIDYLFNKGVSMNYNEPMTLEQIQRKGEEWQRITYNNIIATHNLVNISQVKGKDLEIVDTDKYDYILTYSFPCQDLSLAGKRAGMEKDSGTRSGLLWEVERILDECNSLGNLPKILLMENVPEVVGTNNIEHFKKWRYKLEQLGYSNYDEILNAKDYGIPQNRRRCFMISILGDYNYTFPKREKLKLKLKDMLEEEVDEKYYLSDKIIDFFYKNSKKNEEVGNGFRFKPINHEEATIAKTITTRAGGRMDDNFIVENVCHKALKETLEKNDLKEFGFIDSYNRDIRKDNLSGTITTRVSASNNTFICVPEATKKGYAEAHEGDSVNLEQPNSKTRRGRVGKEIAQTLLTGCQQGVVVKVEDLRIRKLTPKECFRLMGVKDEDYENIAKNQSDASLYHLAGDSIVVNVLMAIFKQLL